MYPLPPIGSGVFLGISREYLKKKNIRYEDYRIELSHYQLYLIERWSMGNKIAPKDLWGAFGARHVTSGMQIWFQECLLIKKAQEEKIRNYLKSLP